MRSKFITTILIVLCSVASFAQECYFGHEYVQSSSTLYKVKHSGPDRTIHKTRCMYLEDVRNVMLFKRTSYSRSTGEPFGNGDINPLAILRDETVPYRIMQTILPAEQFDACLASRNEIWCDALVDPVSYEVGELLFELFYGEDDKQMLTITPEQISEFEKQFRMKIMPAVSITERDKDWDYVRIQCCIFHPDVLQPKGEVLTK